MKRLVKETEEKMKMRNKGKVCERKIEKKRKLEGCENIVKYVKKRGK